MKLKSLFLLGLKLVLLTILLFVCFLIGSRLAGLTARAMAPAEGQQIALIMLGVCFLMVAALAFPILRSGWRGWRLVLAMAGIFFGVMTFLSQIESIVFLNNLVKIISLELIVKIVIQGVIVVALFTPLAVLILGKMRGQSVSSRRFNMPWKEWAWKLAVLAISYFLIYMTFGYLVAWQSPAVRSYYAGLVMPAWMPFFQLVRAIIWVLIAVPVIKMMKGRTWEAGLAVALLYSVLMSAMLLVPGNAIMPDGVRIAHFKEIFSSNFLFGCLVVWVLNIGKESKKNKLAYKHKNKAGTES